MTNDRIPVPAYWQAVAQSIDAQDAMATLFITHRASIGAAREEILKELLRAHTHEPYRVQSGFVHRLYTEPHERYCSPQLDVVVFNPCVAQPDYSIGHLAVLSDRAVAAIVEVKTDLDGAELSSILDIWENVSWLYIPMFGFAFDGLTFSTFVEQMAEAIRTRAQGVPQCLAVHRRNYVFVRSHYRLNERHGRHRPAEFQFAVDFGSSNDARGQAAGCLLNFFLGRLGRLDFEHLTRWFNDLPIAAEQKVRFSADGDVEYGNVPSA
jgi:hypothetical protein